MDIYIGAHPLLESLMNSASHPPSFSHFHGSRCTGPRHAVEIFNFHFIGLIVLVSWYFCSLHSVHFFQMPILLCVNSIPCIVSYPISKKERMVKKKVNIVKMLVYSKHTLCRSQQG